MWRTMWLSAGEQEGCQGGNPHQRSIVFLQNVLMLQANLAKPSYHLKW